MSPHGSEWESSEMIRTIANDKLIAESLSNRETLHLIFPQSEMSTTRSGAKGNSSSNESKESSPSHNLPQTAIQTQSSPEIDINISEIKIEITPF